MPKISLPVTKWWHILEMNLFLHDILLTRTHPAVQWSSDLPMWGWGVGDMYVPGVCQSHAEVASTVTKTL